MSSVNRTIAALASAVFVLGLSACANGGGDIATVNGQGISKADFDSQLESTPVARGTLQQLVQEQLLNQYAQQNNITVSDDEIKVKEDELKANFPNGSWDDMLKARGLTEDQVHKILRQQIILDKAVGKDIKISDKQVEDYFNKNHASFDKPEQARARHILVQDQATAQKVEKDLKGGADFAAEAKKYSVDPGSKEKGGDLGFFRRGQMVPAFDQAAFSLPINKISDPVKSPFGYHIIQVQERTPGQKATLANTKDKIVSTLRQQQEAPLIQPFLLSLQQKATIDVKDPRFQGVFPSPAPSSAASATSASSAAPAASAAASPAASSSP